jgi:UDP-N-acetylglucosamine 2-epimerase (non-hydrolysing)
MEGSAATTELAAPVAKPDPAGPQAAKLAVPVVVGTRPEAIKLVPIILALRDSDCFHPVVVSTGQHHQMVAEIFELAGIETDVELWVGSGRAPLNERVRAVMGRFDDFCREWFSAADGNVSPQGSVLSGKFPAAVLVHGDTSSAMAAALGAFHLRIPVMHVEAGLRAGGLNLTPFPEELNRRLISKIVCFHFAPTATNQENLIRENIPEHQIFVTGNTGIDALRWASEVEAPFPDPAVAALYDGDQRVVVVTAHRRENWENGLEGVATGVARLAASHPDIRFVAPLHPNPLVHERLGEPLTGLDNVLLTEPMGYAAFARMLGRCDLVITDSGGIQEEAPSLGKPVLVARESTERTEGVDAGTLSLVGTNPDRIEAEGERLLDDPDAYRLMAEAHNPYGDGRAAERIVAALDHLRWGGEPPQQFGSGYEREAVLLAAGYEGRLDPAGVPADARGRNQDEMGSQQDQEASELWPS